MKAISLLFLIPIFLISGCNDTVTGIINSINISYKFAYASGNLKAISIINSNGSNNRLILTTNRMLGPIDWTPDNKYIVFEEHIYDTTYIYKININTGKKDLLFTGLHMSTYDIAVSPKGDKISFVLNHISNDAAELRIMDINGLNQKILFSEPGKFAASPKWYQDSEKLIFNLDGQIYSIRSDGSDLTNLTNNNASNTDFSFSLDGRKIVYNKIENYRSDICIMNSDGTNIYSIIKDESPVLKDPIWGPDNKYIIFLKTDTSLTMQLFRIDLQNESIKQLTFFDGGHRFSPIATPNGDIIYYSNNTNDFQIIDLNGDNRRVLVQLDENIGIQYFSISGPVSIWDN
jgi:Tol biopolymer transport system component